MLPRVRIVGKRGSWMARAGNEELPVLHQHWRNGAHGYCDPMRGVKRDGARYRGLVDALAGGDCAIVQKDRIEGETLARDGYVGVFRHTGFAVGQNGEITLKLVEKVAEPAPR